MWERETHQAFPLTQDELRMAMYIYQKLFGHQQDMKDVVSP
jgi:hypothetical protein